MSDTQAISIIINGKVCRGKSGDTVLNIAMQHGIDIPNLCYNGELDIYGACGMCVVEAKGQPKLLRACSALATDGLEIETESPRVVRVRKTAMELLMADHSGDCLGPCTLACPAQTSCHEYVKQIGLGNDLEAVRIIKEKLPLPASIGRVCPHPCETACRRQLVEEPVSIAFLKAYAGDKALELGDACQPPKQPASGKKVGIIGGGPAGLTAAYYLALAGHKVTIYDFLPKMGGMLRYGIPNYRLPKQVLDAEIEQIAKLGVKMVNNISIGWDFSFEEIRAKFDAMLVSIGAWESSRIGCPGEDLDGVLSGVRFLRRIGMGVPQQIGKRVAVVGGGNSAMDACRSALRLGAEQVYVIYRRSTAEMPAEKIEVEEAREEGVIIKPMTHPAEIIGDKQGKVKAVRLQLMRPGEPDASGRSTPVPIPGRFEELEVDTVIAAIGQKANVTGFEELRMNKKGIISADERYFSTSMEGVFAAGDATNKGSSIAIAAISEGKKAADVIDMYLQGIDVPYREEYLSKRESVPAAVFAHLPKAKREQMPHMSAEERKHTFDEMNYGFREEQARKEAQRCLECGCHEYHNCKLIDCARRYEIEPERLKAEQQLHPRDRQLVCIERDQGKCILCGLCVRTCDEQVGKSVLGLVGRGYSTVIKPEFTDDAVLAACQDCKQCAEVCPTGALRIL